MERLPSIPGYEDKESHGDEKLVQDSGNNFNPWTPLADTLDSGMADSISPDHGRLREGDTDFEYDDHEHLGRDTFLEQFGVGNPGSHSSKHTPAYKRKDSPKELSSANPNFLNIEFLVEESSPGVMHRRNLRRKSWKIKPRLERASVQVTNTQTLCMPQYLHEMEICKSQVNDYPKPD